MNGMRLISALSEAYRLLEKADIKKKRDSPLNIRMLWQEEQGAMSTTEVPRVKASWNAHLEEMLLN